MTDAGADALLFGVNGVDHADGNAAITVGRDVPWLQDTEAVDAWGSWGVAYRDVVVLDADHVVVGVINLTDDDLGDPETEAALRELLGAP